MTKRSNHIPVLTTMEMKDIYPIGVRSFLDHSVVSGIARLQVTSTQYAQPMGPNMRFHIMKDSQCDAEYQAMKISIPYPYATMNPVASITLPILSIWRSVTIASRW